MSVIGAGFGGLAAAVRLRAAGARVTLFERGAGPGGKAGTWREGGFRFDTGPTVLTLPAVVEATFAAAGRDCPVEMVATGNETRYRFASGRVWDVGNDLDRTVASLEAGEADGYRRALARARELYEAAAPTFLLGPAPTPAALLRYALRHGVAAAPGRRLPDLLDALGVRGDLRTFFLRFATYVGADPYRSPAVLHNIAWVELGLGTRHVRGGLARLALALEATLLELGGETRYGSEVRELVRRGDRIREVVTDDGSTPCDAVVVAIDRTEALSLLGRPLRREREPSLSGLVWQAGVRGRDERLAQHTVLFPADYEQEFAEIRRGRHPSDGTLYVAISSRRDPEDAPPGHDNLFVMANAPALPLAAGRGVAGDRARADDPAEAGKRALLATLARRGFDLGGDVVVERWSTPLTFAATGHRGSLYGTPPHGLVQALRAPNAVRGLPNVALAGGTVHPGGGVPLALLSGGHAATLLARHLDLATPGRR